MQAILTFPDIDPVAVSITVFGTDLALRWYALAYIAGILAGWGIAVALVRAERLWPGGRAPMSRAQVDDLVTAVILGILLGGRLGFVLFYEPGYYLTHPLAIPMVWRGGMSFHGGLIGVVLGVAWFCRSRGVALLAVADALAVAVPPGLMFGRLANFVNAELWGRPSHLPWAVVFPGELAARCPSGWEGPCSRHPSQLYEAALEGLLLGAVTLWLAWLRGWLRVPGALTGVFCLGYGVIRFALEYVRQPDPQFVSPGDPIGYAVELGPLGLTMGQLLSLPLIALGLGLLLRARERERRAPA